MYTKCSYKHMLVIQYFPTNSEFSHNSKTKFPSPCEALFTQYNDSSL